MDYCDAPSEVAENPQAKELIARVANGNKDAQSFLWDCWNFFQCIDDMVDRDKPVRQEAAARCLVKFISTITFNPFYINNCVSLHTMVVQAFNRWIDGDEWSASDDPVKATMGRVVRCGDVDLVLHVAYLTGGWDHMRAMRDARSYDK